MPTRERVKAFIATVEAGRYVEAIEQFYAPEATMRENNAAPRGPRDALVAQEKKVLAAHKAARTLPGSTYVLDGDAVVIHWVFEFTRPDGSVFRIDELAHQRWQGGHIVEERFFYDPGQARP